MPILVDDHNESEVQRIEGERTVKGNKEYLVKWRGYGDNE
jgi:hypothetical protein